MSNYNEGDLLYLDTNFYISYYLGENNDLGHKVVRLIENEKRQFAVAKRYFNTSQRIFFSYLIAMEIFSVVRATLSNSIMNVDDLNKRTTELFHCIMGGILKDGNNNFVIENNNGNEQYKNINIFLKASAINNTVKGKFKQYNNCNKCNSQVSQRVHKCVGVMDIIHAVNAKMSNCNKFVTFDKHYGEIANTPELKPLKIEVVNSQN
ncbi:MAG: hypothetical protein R2685_04980 [Candidatus Nitrosocosmicus sp.]|nr:hypothetical protein [Candidatus Nitrosocosmicus sp.]